MYEVLEKEKSELYIFFIYTLLSFVLMLLSIFLFFTMANIRLPGTGSFIGEFLILAGSFKTNTSATFISATGMIIGGCYSLWLFNRISYGNLKVQYLKEFIDINRRETYIFLPLIFGTITIGLYPEVFLKSMAYKY